jgi:hypothetical protein
MPYSEKQRKAMFEELARRKKGGRARLFKGMSYHELMKHAHAPMKKKKK